MHSKLRPPEFPSDEGARIEQIKNKGGDHEGVATGLSGHEPVDKLTVETRSDVGVDVKIRPSEAAPVEPVELCQSSPVELLDGVIASVPEKTAPDSSVLETEESQTTMPARSAKHGVFDVGNVKSSSTSSPVKTMTSVSP